MIATSTITNNASRASDIAAALRQRVLHLSLADLQISDSQPGVWGVVVETSHPDTVASLVALVDGSVSLYVSDGNGCVGCGAQREVRAAGVELLKLANDVLPQTDITTDTDLPPVGYVRFYLLIRTELRSAQIRLEEITHSEPLGVLFFEGQRVLAAIERARAGQSLAHEIRLAMNAIQQTPLSEPNEVREPALALNYGDEQCLSVGNVVRLLRT